MRRTHKMMINIYHTTSGQVAAEKSDKLRQVRDGVEDSQQSAPAGQPHRFRRRRAAESQTNHAGQ